MSPKRLASLTLAATVALFSSGCLTPCNEGGLLSRLNPFHRKPDCTCMEGGDMTISGMPTDGPTFVVPPQGAAPQASPQGQPPRIITVPQQQAPNVPYSPTGLRK